MLSDTVLSLLGAGHENWIELHSEEDAQTHYVDMATVDGPGSGVLVGRPTTGLPATHTMAVSVEWSLPSVPAGTVVRINGIEMGTLDAPGLVLEFPVAGVRVVDLMPPFPWLPAACRIEVTE